MLRSIKIYSKNMKIAELRGVDKIVLSKGGDAVAISFDRAFEAISKVIDEEDEEKIWIIEEIGKLKGDKDD